MTRLAARTAIHFDGATALTPIPGRPGDFAVELDPGWASLAGVHGGYLSAISVRGAAALVQARSVRTISTSFLRAGQVGPATLSVREVRSGRSFSTVTAELAQDGELLTTSRLTLLTPQPGVEWRSPWSEPLPPPEGFVRIDPSIGIAHFQRVDALLDPASLPFGGGDRAMVRGYLRPLEERPVDAAWLAMAVDWFPPPAFVRLTPPTGGVSIDLTTHIHRSDFVLAADEWLTGVFEVDNSTGGLAVEHGRIARSDGTVVAESFHTRLTAQR